MDVPQIIDVEAERPRSQETAISFESSQRLMERIFGSKMKI
jgi:hypothetical protein